MRRAILAVLLLMAGGLCWSALADDLMVCKDESAAPDSAIVEVSAFRTRGAVVPGSGQRFIIHFQ